MNDWWSAAAGFYSDLDDGGVVMAGHPRHYMKRLYADFNAQALDGRIVLNTIGSLDP